MNTSDLEARKKQSREGSSLISPKRFKQHAALLESKLINEEKKIKQR